TGRSAGDEKSWRTRIGDVEQANLIAKLRGQQVAEVGQVLRRAGQFGFAELGELAVVRQSPRFQQVLRGIGLGWVTDEDVVGQREHRMRPEAGKLQRVDQVRFNA